MRLLFWKIHGLVYSLIMTSLIKFSLMRFSLMKFLRYEVFIDKNCRLLHYDKK